MNRRKKTDQATRDPFAVDAGVDAGTNPVRYREESSPVRTIAVTGVGLCEPVGPAAIWRPRLNNAYEQELFRAARRESVITDWRVRSFTPDDFTGQSRSPLNNLHLRAQEIAFHDALSAAGLVRKIGRKQSRRVGVIYIDFYGNTSSLERELSSRELYYLDVYPTYLLQNHNISGFSIKMRGERNGVMEALEVAQTLIHSRELDTVILGGVFPCYAYLFLSEAREEARVLKRLARGGELNYCERSMFLVIEDESVANERGQTAKFRVDEPAHYRLPAGLDFGSYWSARWQTRKDSEGAADIRVCFGGAYGAAATDEEFAAFARVYPDAARIDLGQAGDSGQLNALLPFTESFAKQIGGTNHPTTGALIHTWDRNGSGSDLRVQLVDAGQANPAVPATQK